VAEPWNSKNRVGASRSVVLLWRLIAVIASAIQQFDARHRNAHLYGLDHRAYGRGQRRESADRAGDRFRYRVKANREFGDDAQGTLGTDHQSRQIVARRGFAGAATGFQDAAIGQDHRHAEDVFAHGSIAHCVGARRACGGHAAEAGIGTRVDGEKQARTVQVRRSAPCA
jgi:hypothetical protein